MTASLLVELQTEELPPKSLKTLGRSFADGLHDGLRSRGLAVEGGTPELFATPRRLGVLIPQVDVRAADRVERKKLMPAKVAFDAEGSPTAALAKRLEKEGASIADTRVEGGDVWLAQDRAGVSLADGLQAALDETLAKLPIAKRMTYQRSDDRGETEVQFVRPAHALVALHGNVVVPVRALGLDAGRVTAGHRFLGRMHLTIADAQAYEDELAREGKVVASFATRRASIVEKLLDHARGDRIVMPDTLLDEVNALVEWPVVYEGTFDASFLDVPQECLILTMQQNQKYFAVTDAKGAMVNRFLVVSNLETDDPSAIVGGNERVLRARLADAKFFYDQDRKKPLASRVDGLKSVVYHNKLGSQYERMQRVTAIAERIATLLGHDATDAQRAATLAKADLLTDMVGEFPELQGLMGRYYATHDGEKADVAAAIEEQYKPRFAGDELPATDAGVDLALADKLETLVGLFGIGAIPTGDKDPFALRRHALGVVRMLVEKQLRIDVATLLSAALDAFASIERPRDEVIRDVAEFIRVRLAGYCRELGYSTNEVESVIHGRGLVSDIVKRLEAVRAFAAMPESASLAAADKRVRNILAKSTVGDGHAVDTTLLTVDAEIALHGALLDVEKGAAAQSDDFRAALVALATLKDPVDRFFDEVMVNADDPRVRANRLGLLARLHVPMNRVADLSKLAA